MTETRASREQRDLFPASELALGLGVLTSLNAALGQATKAKAKRAEQAEPVDSTSPGGEAGDRA